MPDRRPPEQVFRPINPRLQGLVALLLLLLPLAACGKMPNQVDPPPGVADDAFPKTYPDPATDPKP